MSTNHDEVTSWRDLTSQLTEEQIDKIADMEARSPAPASETAEALLQAAREWATATLVGRGVFADVQTPPDATNLYLEPADDEGGVWVRTFDGTARKAARGAEICVQGRQYEDGRASRTIVIDARDDYSSSEARQIAAALLDAADELDRLQGMK